ncbi:TIM-barrel domain-containing protein [Chitinophaga pollutisoli]|uniref:TIM-barrel domain-containing protein n=1 Tax=Chitinophaga pollutisoli TaxID=3133966 RepID=A0ABZ2YPM4_9BACT
MNIRFTLPLLCALLCQYTSLSAQLQWREVMPGVWKGTAGTPEKVTLLNIAAAKPDSAALGKLPSARFPLDRNDISVKLADGKVYLRFPLEKNEQLFGLGLNFKTVNQRGRVSQLHVDHYGGKDDGRTHAPVPLYISSRGYGVLVDAARYITVYAGTAVRTDTKNPPVLHDRNGNKQWESQPYSDAVEMLVPAAGAEVYIFAGPTAMNAVQRYNLFNGGGYLPPKWGLGFTQRVPTLYSQQDIVREAKEFEGHNFPLDFIGVEPGWHSMAYPCTFEWDPNRFPDPKGFIINLANMGVKANLWLNPYVSPKSSLYAPLKSLSGSHTVWNGLVADFTLPEAKALFREHFLKNHIALGVSGYKMDENDGYDKWLWPDVATFPSGTSAEQMRQIYGIAMQQMTDEWFREQNRRTYGLVRASNAGASRFPYVIYNDYYSHPDFITALVNSSFIGVLWTPEVRASKSAEEWVRRMQSVCFSPMAMLNAWADGTKPWSFPEVETAVQEVAMLRMQLLPYLYSTFAQYRFEGKPPFRSMNLIDGFAFTPQVNGGKLDATLNPYEAKTRSELKDQYMMGDNMIVAPFFAGDSSRKVYLPKGKWYDFYTGELAGEDGVITVKARLDRIPLFIRDGGLIPMIPPRRQAPKPGEVLPLEVRVYGSAPGDFLLYDDDGNTFDFERGQFTRVLLKAANGKGSMEKPAAGKPFGYGPKVKWTFMTAQAK